jgi:general secretion pathway protein A
MHDDDVSAQTPRASRTSGPLTYEPFHGLREKAFSLSPDPRFLYRSPSHGPAFDALSAGIRRREGLIVLTGEIGTGKTTLCRSVLQHLDRRTFAAFVADPFVSREELLKALLADFGVVSMGELARGRFQGASRADLSYPLYEFLDALAPLQAFAVVVIDEAQNLSLPLLEEIRILSELERREKLIQLVLIGQPELRSSLKLPQMRQVDQRVSLRCELTALDAEATAGYVNHRLAIAGGEGRVEFSADALEAVYRGSNGVPRLINRLCDRALESAYTARATRIDASFVWSAIDDLGLNAVSGPDRAGDKSADSLLGFEPIPRVEPGQRNGTSIRVSSAAPRAIVPPASEPGPQLSDFAAESAPPEQTRAERGRSTSRQLWAAGVAASLLGFTASGAAVLWYLRAETVYANVEAPLLPPPPPIAPSRPVGPPPVEAPAPVDPVTAPAPAPTVAAPPALAGGYAILVASFSTRARADQVVEELATAGYRAHAVEHDYGQPRGRLVQVSVGDYTSAIEVQRDLQRIRELPGGFTDARIVERE